jgi:hypothetical protein
MGEQEMKSNLLNDKTNSSADKIGVSDQKLSALNV